ncbi:MAG: riboflavin synthase, partial [Gemmatimonadetes bacterium]
MFTGIVAAVGRLAAVSQNNGAALRITAPFRAVKKGESIAVNGACLTVERVVKGGFTVQAVGTTLGRTLIGE